MGETKQEVLYDGEAYDKASAYQLMLCDRVLDRIDFSQHHEVLDVGCGNGAVTLRLWGRNESMNVTGLDVSPTQVDVARRNHAMYVRRREEGVPGWRHGIVDFRVGDVMDMDEVERYDLVFSNFALHWLRRPRQGYERIFRALAHGGELAVQQGCAGGLAGLHATARKAIRNLGLGERFATWQFPRWSPTRDEFEAVLRDVGFEQVDVSLVEENLEATPQLVEDFIAASLIFYQGAGLSSDEYQKLVSEFRRLCAEDGYDPSDCNLVAFAQKR